VERRSRAEELRNLLVQGLSRRAVRSTSLRGYLLLAVPASVLGAIVAELAWALTRTAIPTGEPVGSALAVPGARALLAWAATAAALILTAILLGEALARAAMRNRQSRRARGVPALSERSPA
jgi:chromate transport protein ChrA